MCHMASFSLKVGGVVLSGDPKGDKILYSGFGRGYLRYTKISEYQTNCIYGPWWSHNLQKNIHIIMETGEKGQWEDCLIQKTK